MKTVVKCAGPALRIAAGTGLIGSVFVLSGCVGMAPTYGTGKHADVQLVEDVTGMFAIAPKQKEQIDYKPRPELVKPGPGATATLPAPQDNIVTASAGSAWPESPEQRRARIRATATANQDNPEFEPEVAAPATRSSRAGVIATQGSDIYTDGRSTAAMPSKDQRAEFNRRLAMSKQGSPTNRRYLSEPPLEYRQPAATAPADDVGEDEWKKERRRKAGYTKKGSGSSWWPF